MPERTKLFSVTLKDCRVETMRPDGKGGQGMQKRDSKVRITHIASGAVGQSSESREQLKNKKLAFRRMAESPKFQAWVKMQSSGLSAWLAEQMQEGNLRIEYVDTE